MHEKRTKVRSTGTTQLLLINQVQCQIFESNSG